MGWERSEYNAHKKVTGARGVLKELEKKSENLSGRYKSSYCSRLSLISKIESLPSPPQCS